MKKVTKKDIEGAVKIAFLNITKIDLLNVGLETQDTLVDLYKAISYEDKETKIKIIEYFQEKDIPLFKQYLNKRDFNLNGAIIYSLVTKGGYAIDDQQLNSDLTSSINLCIHINKKQLKSFLYIIAALMDESDQRRQIDSLLPKTSFSQLESLPKYKLQKFMEPMFSPDIINSYFPALTSKVIEENTSAISSFDVNLGALAIENNSALKNYKNNFAELVKLLNNSSLMSKALALARPASDKYTLICFFENNDMKEKASPIVRDLVSNHLGGNGENLDKVTNKAILEMTLPDKSKASGMKI